jgi:tetratricopeptide (TPR) repeat protein
MAIHSRESALRGALLFGLLVFLLPMMTGCGNEEFTARYRAEKMLWNATKLQRAITENPELATDEMRALIVEKYELIIAEFPPPEAAHESDLSMDALVTTSISGRSRIILAGLLAAEDRRDESAELLASVRDEYRAVRPLAVEAALSLASLHEASGDWEAAVAEFDLLVENWPPAYEDGSGPDARILRTPMRKATGFMLRGQESLAAAAFNEARSYWRHWEEEWPGSVTAIAAASLVAESFSVEQRWGDAVDAYEKFDDVYGDEGNRAALWLTVADIYMERLERTAEARVYYEKVSVTYGGEIAGATADVALAVDDIRARRYSRGRDRLESVIAGFVDEEAVAATATYHIARSFELENRWDEAIPYYRTLSSRYPSTMYGLTAPLHVAGHYTAMGEDAAAATALSGAGDAYERVIRDFVGTPAELVARNNLVETRLRQGLWRQAAEALVESAERFPESSSTAGMLIQAADLYSDKLGDDDSARGLLESIVRLYPGEPGGDAAQQRLDELGG